MAMILSFYFLWGYLGPSSLAGLVILVLLIPVNSVISNRMKKYQKENMKNKDMRIKVKQSTFFEGKGVWFSFFMLGFEFC